LGGPAFSVTDHLDGRMLAVVTCNNGGDWLTSSKREKSNAKLLRFIIEEDGATALEIGSIAAIVAPSG